VDKVRDNFEINHRVVHARSGRPEFPHAAFMLVPLEANRRAKEVGLIVQNKTVQSNLTQEIPSIKDLDYIRSVVGVNEHFSQR